MFDEDKDEVVIGVSFPRQDGDERLLNSYEEQVYTGAEGAAVEKMFHLVQDEDRIAEIHEYKIPPDEYYVEFKKYLQKKYPKCRESLVDHMVACAWAFDTAAGFGLSFGIKKFQLAQHKVKYVGEIVGRDGRSPNPDLCAAIRNWPPITNLKELQGFLGTTNYGRQHAGPTYARVAAPLRALLGKEAVWPPNAEQLQAIEGLKKLICEEHVLAVPDEKSAIIAAHAWQNGLPAAGHPYEAVADTSKIAMGGVMGQAREAGGKLFFLLYWSGALTAAQSQWHPQEQELYGILNLAREIVKHFGRIPKIYHTDHGTLVRLEYLPLDRIDAKHYRWFAEITQGGDVILYNPGTSVLHKVADGLSRECPYRDRLLLGRVGDWAQTRRNIRGVEKETANGQFTDDDPERFDPEAPGAFPEDGPTPAFTRREDAEEAELADVLQVVAEYGPVELRCHQVADRRSQSRESLFVGFETEGAESWARVETVEDTPAEAVEGTEAPLVSPDSAGAVSGIQC